MNSKGHGSFTIIDAIAILFGLILIAPIALPMIVSEMVFGPDTPISKYVGYPLTVVWSLFLLYTFGRWIYRKFQGNTDAKVREVQSVGKGSHE